VKVKPFSTFLLQLKAGCREYDEYKWEFVYKYTTQFGVGHGRNTSEIGWIDTQLNIKSLVAEVEMGVGI